MSAIEPLKVTVELASTELVEHDGQILVRCPLNGAWVALSDYYSEDYGSLLPLVGKVDYEANKESWVQTGESPVMDGEGKVAYNEPVMEKVAVENPIVWKEVVRILAKPEETPAESGTLAMGVHEEVGMKDKF